MKHNSSLYFYIFLFHVAYSIPVYGNRFVLPEAIATICKYVKDRTPNRFIGDSGYESLDQVILELENINVLLNAHKNRFEKEEHTYLNAALNSYMT